MSAPYFPLPSPRSAVEISGGVSLMIGVGTYLEAWKPGKRQTSDQQSSLLLLLLLLPLTTTKMTRTMITALETPMHHRRRDKDCLARLNFSVNLDNS